MFSWLLFIVNGDETVKGLLRGMKHIVFNWLDEKERLLEKIRGVDIAVVDSYMADKSFYEDIALMTDVAVNMDDNKRIDYSSGVVVNGTMLAGEMNYPVNENID